jgi:hypothetical protein
VPAVKNGAWARNPIDSFILHTLEEHGLEPSAPADKLALLRRVTFDLTGLPPTPEEQAAFLADQSPHAYDAVVERLLASPRFGERWAQHWLDLVRYSESDGFKADDLRPNAHKYRDWVIRAMNDDLPYDRFVRLQLAGDELDPENPDAQIATGLLRLYPDEFNAADLRQRRQEILDDVTENTGLVFLGLTIGCAQCHNHKFDDILQTDYFRLQAFFAPLLPRDDAPEATPQQRAEFASQQAKWEEATASVRAEIEALLAPEREKALKGSLEKFSAEVVAAVRTPPEQRTSLQRQLAYQSAKYTDSKDHDPASKLKGEKKKRYDELLAKLATFDKLKPQPLPTIMTVHDTSREAPPTFRLAAGSFKHPAEQVEPGFPLFLGASEPSISPPSAAAATTGRRTALANWLTRRDHPLTARIIVNRLWANHFGRGIVATPNDYGAQGDPPTHPELLDWLAVELMDSGWSLKAIHRLIVTSATYQETALVDAKNAAQAKALLGDPTDNLLWHFRRQRLTGEALRDAVLQVSGDLNLRMYGPSARPELPEGLGNYAWKPDARAEDRDRRSIYVLARRNLRLPVLDAFDLPDMHNSCPRRSTTTTAPQALVMLNSKFTLDEARRWSGRLFAAASDDRALISAAYGQAYCRQPTAAELDLCTKFIAAQATAIGRRGSSPEKDILPEPLPKSQPASHAAAVVDFCHALLNSNEFLYVD